MRKTDTTISEEALNVIRYSSCDGKVLVLPPGQLDRKLYKEVNEALERVGGKWKRGVGHVFATDPRQKIGALLEAAAMPVKNALAYYATPREVVELLLEQLDPICWNLNYAEAKLLEPSAGEGAIADALREYWPRATIHTAEMDDERRAVLERKGYRVIARDFLEMTLQAHYQQYDAIVMNPPFAVPGDPLVYVKHIDHAWVMLKPGGMLVSVAPAGLLFREDARTRALREMAEKWGTIFQLEARAFAESGTEVNAAILAARKPGGELRARKPAAVMPGSEFGPLFSGVAEGW